MQITLLINGKKHFCEITPDEMLLESLRVLGYVGVKSGCDTSSCGLCTVWVDEKPILSCTYLTIRAVGKRITTIEGVQEEAAYFGGFLAKEGAEQCGFCSPGLIMSVLAMKKELQQPSDQEINEYLQGNLCRCTGYQGQLRAIRHYLEAIE